ncbi:MAG: hypothetical protein GC199_06870 [Alphaproteobacteria bacterium]|nr:hypothetical protein [Alphaproteobacteria bacterium]
MTHRIVAVLDRQIRLIERRLEEEEAKDAPDALVGEKEARTLVAVTRTLERVKAFLVAEEDRAKKRKAKSNDPAELDRRLDKLLVECEKADAARGPERGRKD